MSGHLPQLAGSSRVRGPRDVLVKHLEHRQSSVDTTTGMGILYTSGPLCMYDGERE